MLSSNTEIYAVFIDSPEQLIPCKMEIDEYAMKKLKKIHITECELIYTTGKVVNDWKKNGMRFVELILHHPIYPVVLLYDLDLSKINKEIIPNTLYFKEKEYEIKADTDESGSFFNSIIHFFKK